jgi:hypothetical protein
MPSDKLSALFSIATYFAQQLNAHLITFSIMLGRERQFLPFSSLEFRR